MTSMLWIQAKMSSTYKQPLETLSQHVAIMLYPCLAKIFLLYPKWVHLLIGILILRPKHAELNTIPSHQYGSKQVQRICIETSAASYKTTLSPGLKASN